MIYRLVILLAAVAAAVPAVADAAPSCVPPVEVANIPIERVEPNGMLVTNDGRAVKLEGVLLPGGARDRAPRYFADQALSELGELTRGQLADLRSRPPKQDRYGRLRAQVILSETKEPWLQAAMLKRGLARVSITPDRTECAKELYDTEAVARAARAGIWTSSAYGVLPASDVPLSDLGLFEIVEGRVTTAQVRGGRAYLNFGADWKKDFTATIAPDDLKSFRAVNIDPATFYTGKTIRVRGVLEKLNGPEIEIAVPQQIEILPDLRPAVTR